MAKPALDRRLPRVWASLIAQLIKESACNAGDTSSISGSRGSAGEGRGYPLQYSWASPVAQLVKKKSAYDARDLGSIPGLGRSLEKGKATHSSTLAWRIPCTV